ncbi:hypothetical protein GS4_26_01470 [Gordonia soli NBRC 108243]|uniref:Polysaccharide pyruvyl transferase domain-containing protein n=2 Tax=Gordonia soli TaxID=320799 RepID=M0QMQ1_9ACTN|nr:hypothetical protein GS4_26_01470 [Gordonia soli NBRC 108243]
MSRRVHERLDRSEIIYLVAPSGHPNYGDEVIARAWLRHLARARPHATVVLDCHSPGQAALLLRSTHPRLVVTDTLWQLSIFADEADPPPDPAIPPWEWVSQAATRLGIAPRLSEGVGMLAEASSLHLLGGGYLNRLWPHHVSLATAVAAVSKATGAPAHATGQGLLPVFDRPRFDAFLTAADEFAVFDVRDSGSRDAIADVSGLRDSGDDAWLAVGIGDGGPIATPDTPVQTDSETVILCVQSDLTESFTVGGTTGPDALALRVRELLDHWEVPGTAVAVVEGIPGEDARVPGLLADRLEGSTFLSFHDVWRKGLPAGNGSTWISSRFHPHLIAAAAGDSGVALVASTDYYATKHRSLVEAGSAWSVLGADGALPSRPDAGGFAPADRARAIAAKHVVAEELYPTRTPRQAIVDRAAAHAIDREAAALRPGTVD